MLWNVWLSNGQYFCIYHEQYITRSCNVLRGYLRLCYYINITQFDMLTIWQSVPSSSKCHLYLCKYSTTILLKTNISYSIFCLIGGVPPGRQGSLRPARNTRLHSCVKNMPVKYLPHTKFTFCLLSSNFNRYKRLLSFWFIDASDQKVCINAHKMFMSDSELQTYCLQ